MANEISFSASLGLNNVAAMKSPIGRAVSGLLFDQTVALFSQGAMLVPITTPAAIPLGQLTQPHWCYLCNLDLTNSIQLRNGSGGTGTIQLNPGEPAFFPWIPTAVPFAVALVAPCEMEYMIFSL